VSSLGELIDDAALFPPGSAPMPVAVAAHRRHRTAAYAALIGPFLCPVGLVAELQGELRPGDRLRVGLIVGADRAGLAGLPEAVAAVAADDRLHLDRVELPLGPDLPDLPPGVTVWVEVPWADASLVGLRERGAGAKFRTGGAVVPPVEALAERIVSCHAGVPLPFKCTAGLHSAVRHDGAHGFLNVLVASGTAARGGTVHEVAAVLAETSADRLLAGLRRAGTRGAFRSFGSCSVEEPLADLVALGLWTGT
jgi:hypothetical protein